MQFSSRWQPLTLLKKCKHSSEGMPQDGDAHKMLTGFISILLLDNIFQHQHHNKHNNELHY